jgi:DNA-directed RNA polymerase, mitochondrial
MIGLEGRRYGTRWGTKHRELFLQILRGEKQPPPEIDALLSSRIRREARSKPVLAAGTEEEGASASDDDSEESPESEEAVEELSRDDSNAIGEAEATENLEKLFKLFDERYIDLVKVLPPLPKKGEFDVSSIKRSQYFFS